MDFIKYPMSLYKYGEEKVVKNDQEEKDAIFDGFTGWAYDYERRMNPPKPEEVISVDTLTPEPMPTPKKKAGRPKQ
jgi:hypothetical protein